MKQLQNDEIDIFELFHTLWDGKWIISIFVIIGFLISLIYLQTNEKSYISNIIFKMDNIPPIRSQENVLIDFEKRFYSKNFFEDWKKNTDKSFLKFKNLRIPAFDGSTLTQHEEQIATLSSKRNKVTKKIELFLKIKTKDFKIIYDLYNYINYINNILTEEYLSIAKNEYKIIDSRFKNVNFVDSNIIFRLISFDRYFNYTNKGNKVLLIKKPTIPEDVSNQFPKKVYLFLSMLLGGIVGVLIVFIRHSLKKRKQFVV